MVDFIKGHAYGNDFLFVPASEVHDAEAAARLARMLCDRHTGIGADGLILYEITKRGASMRLLNADGSRAEVSGNGVRCLAAIAVERCPGLAASGVVVETDSGEKRLTLEGVEEGRYTFRAAMGQPTMLRQIPLEAAGERVVVAAMWVGNPQCVVLGPLDEARFRRLGPALERHPVFPDRTNVEFAEVESPDRVRILIWERGVGPTQASGTGACAAAVAAASYGSASRSVTVVSPGGSQTVEWTGDELFLTGWAKLTVNGRWLG